MLMGTTYRKIGFIQPLTFSPMPVLASCTKASQPQPKPLQQKRLSTKEPRGRMLVDTSCPLCKGLEVQHTIAQGGGQCQQEQCRAANQAALFSRPAGFFPDHCQDVFAHSQYRGHGSKNHEQEEKCAPNLPAGHMGKDCRHRVKQQAWPRRYFQPIGHAGGEDDNTG